MQDVSEVLENHIWIGVTWREAFVVPFIPSTVPGWSDACFEPVEWPGSGQPHSDGDQGWCIVRSPATDADGWVYGTAFDHLREDRPGGRASKRTNDRVRSRLWRRVDAGGSCAQQQATSARDGSSASGSRGGPASTIASAASAAAAAAAAAPAGAPSVGKTAWAGAVHAVQTSMPGAVKRASFAGMVNTFLKLVKDAAARHNTSMITPDITGWFFVISTHSDELKRQQLGQLQQLVWFSREPKLQQTMQQGGLGTNPPGIVLQGAAAALAALEASKQPSGGSAGVQDGPQAAPGHQAATQGAAGSSTLRAAGGQHVLKGLPFTGLKMHIGSSASKASSQQQLGSSTSAKVPASPAAGPAGVQLHVGALSVLDDLLAGAQYSQAAYGYVAAAGHLSNLGNAIKMLATLPHFNAITGASLEANIRAMHTLAGFCPQDVLLAAWHNDTFRPCHYVAIDMKRGNIVLGVRGSLELGDLETDVTAAPLPFEFQGVAGWVHEGLLAAAAYVVSNTVDALAEAAQRCPGWPLVVAGHSLGGGVAALVTLLLQQPGAAPRGIAGVRCITIGPPAVLSQELCGLCEEYITSIVLGADPIPRLSTFSVESLLLDLVNMSLSRRVTNQLAATTSSMAASTAGAINTLAAGLTRLANTATSNMVSNVNSMKTSLASFKALPGFPLIDASLTGLSLGGAAAADVAPVTQGMLWGEQGSAGTGSVELTRRQQQQQTQSQEQALAGLREVSDGLKHVHVMLQDDRQQQRASMESQREGQMPPAAGQQQQQAQQRSDSAAQGAGTAVAHPKLSTLTAPPAAAQFDASVKADAAAASPQQQQVLQQQAQHRGDSVTGSPAVPRWQKEQHSSKPGGPKLVSGGPAAANIMIFPKHDDANIITGIQEAWAGLKPRSSSNTAHAAAAAAAADGSSSGDSQPAVQNTQPAAAAAVAAAPRPLNGRSPGSSSRASSSGSRSSVTPFAIEQQPRPSSAGASGSAGASARIWLQEAASVGAEPAAGPAAAGAAVPADRVDSSSSMKRCTSEPSLQQWASDGLQSLGEPSWVKLSRSSDGVGSTQQQQAQAQARQGGGAGGGVGDSTVHALESDLKKTARLYPPGRIFWILSEELVGPAAHQLMTAVSAHLAPGAAATAAAAVAAGAAAAQQQHPSTGPTTSSSGSSHLTPPSPAQMDMPSSVMGPGSKPVLRTQPKQQPSAPPSTRHPKPSGDAPRQQLPAVSSKTAARDAATAHAVAAASAQHILHDVHSLDARRAAAAALQAAQHEHPPLHLKQRQSPQDTAAQLEQQLRLEQQQQQEGEDLLAAAAAAGSAHSQDAAASSVGVGSSSVADVKQQKQQQQLKPLRTLRTSTPSSSVQLSTATAAAAPGAQAAGSSGPHTPAAVPAPAASAANRSSSGPMEVDGSAAGRAAGYGWPTSWGSADSLNPEDLPTELQELVQILGTPCDAASALAIGYKKQVLLQHFWQQRHREASVAAAEAAAAAAAAAASSRRGTDSGSAGRRVRSCSDSHLMQFEDVIRAVDDAGTGAASAAAAAAAIPQLELVDHSWWGTVSSLAGGSSSGSGGGQAVKQQGAAAAVTQAGAAAGGQAGSGLGRALPLGASHRLDFEGSGGAEGAPAAAAGSSLAGTAGGQQQQQQQGGVQTPQPQQQAVQPLLQDSDGPAVRSAKQAAQQQQQQQGRSAEAAAAAARQQQQQQQQQQQSLPELAAESLVELAQLPERLAQSLGGLKLSAGSIRGQGAGEAGCEELGPAAAAGLAALCAPVLNPAAGEGAAAAAPVVSTSGIRLPPVVVMPERDVFSRLLLHRTAVLDHLPSNYVKVLTDMREAFSSMPQEEEEVEEGQQQLQH